MSVLLRRLIGEDIQFVTTVERELWLVNADETQLGQVIMNLAVNARDAMPGGGSLTIGLANMTLDQSYARSQFGVLPGKYVLLSVCDTGCGMTEEIRARMFEPFFTTKEQGKGTGLGLSTVYGIVKEHGGHISVDSAIGKGTTIEVYLPAVEGAIEARVHESSETDRPRATETILVVEDDDQLRHLIVQILESDGYTVLEAENGRRAIELAKHHPGRIHLLLTDIILPGMNGLALAENMISSRICSAVLYMSGYTGDESTRQKAIPADAFLAKPFTPERLLGAVRLLLDSNEQEMNRGTKD